MNLKSFFEEKIKKKSYSRILEIRKNNSIIAVNFHKNTLALQNELKKLEKIIIKQTQKFKTTKNQNQKNLEDFEIFITCFKKRNNK